MNIALASAIRLTRSQWSHETNASTKANNPGTSLSRERIALHDSSSRNDEIWACSLSKRTALALAV